MADFEIKETPKFSDTMQKISVDDAVHADIVNNKFEMLLDNDNYLKKNEDIIRKELSSDTEDKVSEHNASEEAHADIRNLVTTLATRLNTLADSDDTTLDQLSEIVAYIKSNRGLIENVTTNKVNVTDIIDNLTSSATNKPLAAKQGKVLKDLITTLTSTVDGKANKAGDEFTGDVTFDNYIKIKAWPGYGTGSANMWFNANTKTIDFEGDVKNIDLNAISATNADTLDEKHASDFISKEGKDNIVKERFTVLSGTTVSGSGTGDTSKTGYLRIATLTIRSTYIDNPIVFEIAARGWNYTTTLYIKFKSVGNNDPDLASFLVDKIPPDKIYLHKRTVATWDLYVYKSTGYGYSTTYSLRSSLLGITQGAVGIEHPKDVLIETLPSGSIEPNIIIAEKAKDSDTVDGKHASDFVNKSGDTMTGDLAVSSGRSNTLNVTIPCAGRIDEGINSVQDLSEYKTFLGSYCDVDRIWWNIVSTRHGNGWNDGHYLGMYLRSKLLDNGDLLWGKQIGSTKGWQDERTILDSANYKDFCLSLSGGTMTGDLGITYNPPNTSTIGTPVVGGAIISDNLTDLSNYRGFLGTCSPNGNNNWNHVISVRHRNGFGDGRNYGMYLRTPITTNEDDSNIYWRMQNTGWHSERTLLDSYNYKKFCLPLSGGQMKDNATIYMKGTDTSILLSANNGTSSITNNIVSVENNGCRLSLRSKIGTSDRCGMEALTKSNSRTGGLYFYNGNFTLESYDTITINIAENPEVANAYYFDKYGLYPITANVDIGRSSFRWRNIYATNGTIQTSDRTKKTNINSLKAQKVQAFIHGLNPVSYKMIDGTSGRTHYGFIAQDIEELMNTLHMDSKDFAGFIKSPKKVIKYEDENGMKLENPIEEVIENEYDYALRYDEFIAPLIKVVQEQQKTIEQQQRMIENQQKEIEQIKKELSKIYSPM